MQAQRLSKEAGSRFSILAFLYEDLNKIAVLVNDSPKVSKFSLYRNDDFVEEPTISARTLSFLNTTSIVGSKRKTALTNGFVRYRHASFG